MSWRVAILPQLGYANLYRQYQQDEPWDSSTNARILTQMPSVFGLSGVEDYSSGYVTNFVVPIVAAEAYPDKSSWSLFSSAEGVGLADISDGAANTILVIESTIAATTRAFEEMVT